MKDKDWKNLFGSAPQSFLDQVGRTLDRLEEEENMKKRYKFSVVLVAAALVVALAGVALAAGYPGLIDYLNKSRIAPLEGAETLIESNLGQMENEYFTLSVQEAVYDAYSANVHLVLTPKDPETHTLFHSGMMDGYPEDKEPVLFGISVSQESEDFELFLNSWEAEVREDGSVDVWASGLAEGEAPESISLTVACRYGLKKEVKDILPDSCEMTIALATTAQRQGAKLVPVSGNELETIHMISGFLSTSTVSGQFSIDYTCSTDETSGYIFSLFDMDGHEIETGRSLWSERKESDGTMVQNRTGEMQALTSLPQKVYVEVKAVGGDAVLGKIECNVIN